MKPASQSFVATWFEVSDELPVASIATDADGVVTHWNRFAEQLYGWGAAEALGRNIRTLTVGPSESETAEKILAKIAALEPWQGEFTARTADDQEVEVHVIDLPIVVGGALVGILGLSIDVSEQRRNLIADTERVRRLAEHAEAAADAERRRIAQEVHDDLGQRITALLTELRSLEDRTHGDEMSRLVGHAEALLEAVHRISAELRTPLLDDLGAAVAIEWMVDQFVERTGVQATHEISDSLVGLTPRLADAVFQITRECITNVERHADAKQAHIIVRRNGTLEIIVTDDGRGMTEHTVYGLGLRYLSERVTRLGGTVDITGIPQSGTEVRVRIPLEGQD